MNLAAASPAGRDIKAEIAYTADTGEELVIEVYGPGLRTSRITGTDERHEVIVHDGRSRPGEWSLDGSGFVLVRHRSAVKDFFDPREVDAVYCKEIERLIAQVSGAARVLIYNRFVRLCDAPEREARHLYGPIFQAHTDFTETCGPGRVRALIPDEADAVLAGRCAIIQAWQPIGRPVLVHPLALADARSIAPEDMLRTERRLPDHTRHFYRLRYSRHHRWVYFPEMQPDEILLFKGFDSATDGRTRFVFHTAFDHPDSPPDAPARQSIDVRTLVVFSD